MYFSTTIIEALKYSEIYKILQFKLLFQILHVVFYNSSGEYAKITLCFASQSIHTKKTYKFKLENMPSFLVAGYANVQIKCMWDVLPAC